MNKANFGSSPTLLKFTDGKHNDDGTPRALSKLDWPSVVYLSAYNSKIQKIDQYIPLQNIWVLDLRKNNVGTSYYTVDS
jgi:hypothetical protein